MSGEGLPEYSDALADAVERAATATVTVAARRRIAATGIVWSADGLIVTADHVIEDEDAIQVTLPGGEQASAELVGRDPGSDIALVRVGIATTAAERAPQGSARVGHLVLAVGRPGGQAQASVGVVSAIGGPRRTRTGTQVEGALRSDSTFFPGFSGGPLVDTQGRVLGMNTSRFRLGNLTIAAATVEAIGGQLLAHGRVRRAYLGIGSQAVHLPETAAQESGLLIVSVEADSPASRAGLVVGDVLLGIEGSPTRGAEDLQMLLSPERVGATVQLQILRGGAPHELSATLGERP